METGRIRFLTDYLTRETEPKHYEEGSEHNMSMPSCEHFVNRGVAEFVTSKATPAKDKEKPAKG